MTGHGEVLRVVRASREIAASPERIFELIADPVQQPRWDGNDNLAETDTGRRIHAMGDIFTMKTTKGHVRENHVVEFVDGRPVCQPGVRHPLPENQ